MKLFPGIPEVPNLVEALADMADAMEKGNIKCRLPMSGRDFGFLRFWLSSSHMIRNNLDVVTYYVIEKNSGVAFGMGDTKAAAIGVARRAIKAFGDYFDSVVTLVIDERTRRRELEAKAFREQLESATPQDKVRLINSKRLAVFDKSAGHCHYCSDKLEIMGKWHVEHMNPKSRGGSDSMDNLVASCTPCNYSKGDKTAEEFIAHRAKKSGATA